MKRFNFIIMSICLLVFTFSGNAQHEFSSLNGFIQYSEKNSILIKSFDIKQLQAKQVKIAALLSIPDINVGINGSFTYNTKLPVSVLPSSAFGGQIGETREISIGSKYQTGFVQNMDIKVLNLEGIQNFELAKIHIQITETDALLNKRSLYENIANAYYNIVQLQEQLQTTILNVQVADTLHQVTMNKYAQGLIKLQDLNEAKINLLNIEETKRQIEFSILQQYNALKILGDIPLNHSIKIIENIQAENQLEEIAELPILSTLDYKLALYEEVYADNNLKKANKSLWPTLSFFGNNSYNSYNQDFTVFGGKWVNSNYLGLKLNWSIPNSMTISNKINAKYNLQMAQTMTKQAEIKVQINQDQLNTDLRKALSQYKNSQAVYQLYYDNYLKNRNLYEEGVQNIESTIKSYNNMVNAAFNFTTSQAALVLVKAKIKINNNFSNE